MATTLLLADDSVTIQRVIELMFANETIRVVTVADGHAATAQLEAERPDIVLADVGLPVVDGYALTELVKRSPRTAGVPVLLLTGAFEPIDEGRARQSGCDGVLVKPFEPQRVVSMVKQLLAGQTPHNLWPADMPRADAPAPSSSLLPTPTSTPLSRPTPIRREAVSEVGPLPPPSAIEEVFEIGLDDLDMAFSRLDPVAAPSRLDAGSVSDFERDLQELRSTTPFPESAPPRVASVATTGAFRPLETPLEPLEPLDPLDLEWDLPTPVVVVDAVPLSPVVPAPVEIVPDVAVESEPMPAPEVLMPAPPSAPPPAVELPSTPAVLPPPSLANAFSALLAAEQSQPASSPSMTEADVEEVVRRVVARLTETSERVIREEIDRLKR
jgi:CheY-like chemotaxis protein